MDLHHLVSQLIHNYQGEDAAVQSSQLPKLVDDIIKTVRQHDGLHPGVAVLAAHDSDQPE